MDPYSMDFYLQETSPCIDAGNPELPLDPDNTIADQGALFFDQGLSVNDPVMVNPSEFMLYPAYPNPFNPVTVISYRLTVPGFVNLSVYDISGKLVAELVNGLRVADMHEVVFDAGDLPSGVYLCRLTAGDYISVSKIVLMK